MSERSSALHALAVGQPAWSSYCRSQSNVHGGAGHWCAAAVMRSPTSIAFAVAEAPSDGRLNQAHIEGMCHSFALVVLAGPPGESAELAMQRGWQWVAERNPQVVDDLAVEVLRRGDSDPQANPQVAGGIVCAVLANDGTAAWVSVGDLQVWARQTGPTWNPLHAPAKRLQQERREHPDQKDPLLLPRFATASEVAGFAVVTSALRRFASVTEFFGVLGPLADPCELDRAGYALVEKCTAGQERKTPDGDNAALVLASRIAPEPALPMTHLRWALPLLIGGSLAAGALLGGQFLAQPLFPVLPLPATVSAPASAHAPPGSPAPAGGEDLLPDCPIEADQPQVLPTPATAAASPAAGAP